MLNIFIFLTHRCFAMFVLWTLPSNQLEGTISGILQPIVEAIIAAIIGNSRTTWKCHCLISCIVNMSIHILAIIWRWRTELNIIRIKHWLLQKFSNSGPSAPLAQIRAPFCLQNFFCFEFRIRSKSHYSKWPTLLLNWLLLEILSPVLACFVLQDGRRKNLFCFAGREEKNIIFSDQVQPQTQSPKPSVA